MYDLEAYGNEIRGFYIDLDELPGPIVKTEDELIKAIKKAPNDHSYDEKYENSGEIYTAYILDNYQNLGLGRQMAIACMKELLNKGYITLVTKCLEGNPSNEFHKSLGGVLVGQSTFKPMGIYVGKENVYYHEDLTKSLEYNIEKSNKKNIK